MSSETETHSANLHTGVSKETAQTEHDQPDEKHPIRDLNTQPFSSGFFDKDPITSKARAAYFKIIIPGTFLITIVIWTVLAIYWGALWKTPELTHNLNGWVVVCIIPCFLLNLDH